jgi:hypothetical protein
LSNCLRDDKSLRSAALLPGTWLSPQSIGASVQRRRRPVSVTERISTSGLYLWSDITSDLSGNLQRKKVVSRIFRTFFQATHARGRRVSGRAELPEPRRSQAAPYRGQPVVDPQIHEHGPALRGANLKPRSRRLKKCAKDSGHYQNFCPRAPSTYGQFPPRRLSLCVKVGS